MHLIWENVVKNLMQMWTGQYKGLRTGREDYELHPTVWQAIGDASAASGNTIPGIYGPCPPNVASDKMSWTADTRSFWIQYVGPVLLAGRFTHRKYYTHFVLLVRLIRKCLQFEITDQDIEDIRTGFISWVKEYEQIYYQYDATRLPMCTLTIHALLHIADSIKAVGPVWAYWAFPMERYCGSLQPAIQSRRFPYSSINRYVVDRARLTHIKLVYGLEDQLRLGPPTKETGIAIAGYDTCVLLHPHRRLALDKGVLQDRILACLGTRHNIPPSALQRLRRALPSDVHSWGKVRIRNEGDTIRASSLNAHAQDGRDATFVRYELLVDRHARSHRRAESYEMRTFYGQLQHILVIELDQTAASNVPGFTAAGPFTFLLAVVQQCVIEEDNEDLDIHYYTRLGALEAVDISTIQCLVGRIRDRGRWAVIDRSGTLSRALYNEKT
ncbi:hypothetical protein C8Q78DRAFT_973583 [Trametes maxima]|nr:hypothetical protein C8Q78DRAFT_973583 [Trametes maxima]